MFRSPLQLFIQGTPMTYIVRCILDQPLKNQNRRDFDRVNSWLILESGLFSNCNGSCNAAKNCALQLTASVRVARRVRRPPPTDVSPGKQSFAYLRISFSNYCRCGSATQLPDWFGLSPLWKRCSLHYTLGVATSGWGA